MIVRFTRKGVELTPISNRQPFNDRAPFGIGYNWLSKKMMKKLGGQSLLLKDSVDRWMIDKCLRSLIKWGPEKSCDTLQSNGISILGESPDIKTKNLL